MSNARGSIKFTCTVTQYDAEMLQPEIDSDLFMITFGSCTSDSLLCKSPRQPIFLDKPFELVIPFDTRCSTRFGGTLYCRRRVVHEHNILQDVWRAAPLADFSRSMKIVRQQLETNHNEFEMKLHDPCVENVKYESDTLRMTLHLTLVSITGWPKLIDNQDASDGDLAITDNDLSRFNALWKQVNAKYMHGLQTKVVASSRKCQSSHVPIWASALGELPAPLFVRWLPLKSTVLDARYWTFMIRSAITAFGVAGVHSIEKLKKDLHEQLKNRTQYLDSTTHALRFIVHAACMFANACDYLPDLVRTNDDAERFIDVTETMAGDCEDTAKLVYTTLLWLQRYHSTTKEHNSSNELLHLVSQMLERYVVAFGVFAVTAPAADSMRDGHDSDISENDELMCHSCTVLLSRQYVMNALSGSKSCYNQLLANLPDPTQDVNTVLDQRLPSLVCEGTYLVDPLLHEPHYYVKLVSTTADEKKICNFTSQITKLRKDLNNIRVLAEELVNDTKNNTHVKPLLVRAEQLHHNLGKKSGDDFCNFYKNLNEIWLDLGASGGVIPFAVTLDQFQSKPIFGINMRDFAERHEGMQLIPMYTYTAENAKQIDQVIAHAPPTQIVQFDATDDTVASLVSTITRPYQPTIDRLNKLVQTYQSTSDQPNTPWTQTRITYMINHLSKFSNDTIESLTSFLDTVNTYHFQYHIVPITPDGLLYWIILLIDIRLPKTNTLANKNKKN